MNSFHQKLITLLFATTLTGCASLSLFDDSEKQLSNHDGRAAQGLESCQTALAEPDTAAGEELDPQNISLFVWNMKKGSNPDALLDLERLASDKDLVLIQEALWKHQPVDSLERSSFWSFAPGYETESALSGVMTLSNTAPGTHCYLTDHEPWLRSPKAISITTFGLADTDATLAVINVHAVNFTLGVSDFQRQIGKIEKALANHDGPVILAGDFNTWSARRFEVLQEVSQRLNLNELSFDEDNRVTPFGAVVDRIFVRGLSAIDARTDVVGTSDHNPMSVILRM
jgi:endonuclease/exonuclease/phosphatase (EEP) superfamily protein YafD